MKPTSGMLGTCRRSLLVAVVWNAWRRLACYARPSKLATMATGHRTGQSCSATGLSQASNLWQPMATYGNLHGTCMAPAWHLHGTCMAPAWHLHGTCMAPAWHLHGTCMALHTNRNCKCTVRQYCVSPWTMIRSFVQEWGHHSI